MLSYIYYNNKSSRDFDLVIENIPNIPTTNKIYETIEIDDGENLTKIKGYEDIEISFNFVYKSEQEEFLTKKSLIDNWLLNNTNKYLNYSLDDFSSYLVKQVNISETTTTSRIVRHFSVTFLCRGLKYITSGLKILQLSNNIELNNFGTHESKPLLKIYGSGNVTLTINNTSFTIKNVNEYVIIDSEIKECFKNSTNKGKDMTGDYPILSIGKNIISWSGTVTKIELTPRWRCI